MRIDAESNAPTTPVTIAKVVNAQHITPQTNFSIQNFID